jgi:soluble lytic murein transglycosylase-like protein
MLPLLLLLLLSRRKARSGASPSRGCSCERYLPLFEEFGRRFRIPPAFLRALACRESSCRADNKSRYAWGLMQITESVRLAVPRERGVGFYGRAELLIPRVSLYLCCRTLQNVITTYAAVGEPARWNDPRWVSLVVAGWNGGYSRRGGVARVISYLRERGITPTIDAVHAHARAAGAVKYLAMPDRLAWWRSVVTLYLALRRS